MIKSVQSLVRFLPGEELFLSAISLWEMSCALYLISFYSVAALKTVCFMFCNYTLSTNL